MFLFPLRQSSCAGGDIRERPATPWDDLTGDIYPPKEGFYFGVPRNMKHERHRPNEVMCVSTVEEMGIEHIWVSDNRFNTERAID